MCLRINEQVLSPPKRGWCTLLCIAYGGRFAAELQTERLQGDPEILFRGFILLSQLSRAAVETNKGLEGWLIN